LDPNLSSIAETKSAELRLEVEAGERQQDLQVFI
jgi:hypothetical protein